MNWATYAVIAGDTYEDVNTMFKEIDKQTYEENRRERDMYIESDLELLNELADKAITLEEQEQTETNLWRNCFNVVDNPLPNFAINAVAIRAIRDAWRAIIAGKIKTLSDFDDYLDRESQAA